MIVTQNKKLTKETFEKLNHKDKYEYIHNIYYKYFIDEYNQLIELKKSVLISKQDLFRIKQYELLNWRFLVVLQILEDLYKTNISVTKYFKTKKRPICKSTFYTELEDLKNRLCNTTFDFERLFHESTRPHVIHHKYTEIQRKAIVAYIEKTLEESRSKGLYFNKTTVWLRIRKEGVLAEYGDFSNISLATIQKIYNQETGHDLVSMKSYSKKHKPRSSIKELGHIQMDLKVLGYSETKVGKYVYVFDMIDTSSRLSFSEVLKKADTQNVMECLKKGLEFYKENEINVKSIQTDNAMMFKKTNFIVNNEFHKLLNDNNIKHRRISLGQPQSNGVVERYHLKIDKEAHYRLYNCESIDDVSIAIKDFMNYHNNSRYHYYYELGKPAHKLPYVDRFMKPIDSIKILSWYYKNNQSKMSV